MWINTYTGKTIHLDGPAAELNCESIDIESIAHSLANQCRFVGHTSKFYSVAEHCWLASWFGKPSRAIFKLMHDSAEAFIGDISSPLKTLLPELKPIEQMLQNQIYKTFDLEITEEDQKQIEEADNILLYLEAKRMLATEHLELYRRTEKHPMLYVAFRFFTPVQAKKAFLNRFSTLMERYKRGIDDI